MESNSAQPSSQEQTAVSPMARVGFRVSLMVTSVLVLVAAFDVGGFRASFL